MRDRCLPSLIIRESHFVFTPVEHAERPTEEIGGRGRARKIGATTWRRNERNTLKRDSPMLESRNPQEERITVPFLEGGEYQAQGELSRGMEATSPLLLGFAVSVKFLRIRRKR